MFFVTNFFFDIRTIKILFGYFFVDIGTIKNRIEYFVSIRTIKNPYEYSVDIRTIKNPFEYQIQIGRPVSRILLNWLLTLTHRLPRGKK